MVRAESRCYPAVTSGPWNKRYTSRTKPTRIHNPKHTQSTRRQIQHNAHQNP